MNYKYSSSVLGEGLQLRPQSYVDSLSFQRQKERRNSFHLSAWWEQAGQGWCKEGVIENMNNGWGERFVILVRFTGNLFFRWLRPLNGE